MAGELLLVYECTIKWRRVGFARACVKLDLSRPLRHGILIKDRRDPSSRDSCMGTLMTYATDVVTSIFQRRRACPEEEEEARRPVLGQRTWFRMMRRIRAQ